MKSLLMEPDSSTLQREQKQSLALLLGQPTFLIFSSIPHHIVAQYAGFLEQGDMEPLFFKNGG